MKITDKIRLDWLQRNKKSLYWNYSYFRWDVSGTGARVYPRFERAREAIDAAMKSSARGKKGAK